MLWSDIPYLILLGQKIWIRCYSNTGFWAKGPRAPVPWRQNQTCVTVGGSELWKETFPSCDLQLPKTEQLCLQWQQPNIQSQHWLAYQLSFQQLVSLRGMVAWRDLLGHSKIGAGVNFIFIHSCPWELQWVWTRWSTTVWICLGRKRCFFHVAAIEMGTKYCSSQYAVQRRENMGEGLGTAGFHLVEVPKELGDHAAFDRKLAYSLVQWDVELLFSVLHSFKVEYVLHRKDRTLGIGSCLLNIVCLQWRCLCQWWASPYKWDPAV